MLESRIFRLPSFVILRLQNEASEVLPWHPIEPDRVVSRARPFICEQLRALLRNGDAKWVTTDALIAAATEVLKKWSFGQNITKTALESFYVVLRNMTTPREP